ncbi:MAG: transglycosylase SLT domain-containing protein [Acidobacteriota bacterium]
MFKEKIRGYAVVDYRRLLFMRAAILFFVVFAGLLLFRSYTAGLAGKSEAAPAPYERRVPTDSLSFQKMKDAVLDWMKRNSEMPDEILAHIYDEAAVNPNSDLLLAICKVESNFNPSIKSPREALGLMGIRPDVWLSELKDRKILQSRRDLYLIRTNLASGAYVLQKYLMRRGKLEEALNDYVGGDPDYVKKVVQALGEIYKARMLYAGSHAATVAEADVGKGEVRTQPEG